MTEEKVTGFEETAIEETKTAVEEVAEIISEEASVEEVAEVISEEAVVEEVAEDIAEEIVVEEKKKGGKGLVINAILTGVMIIVLIANLIVSFGNAEKLKELEDVKVVLAYALTGDPSMEFDFAETANEVREQKKMIEELMKETEKESVANN